jgi:potassium voltage-gated channel Shaker-related subfamily A protein 1
MGYFTIEIILRIISTPSIIDFIKDIMNWIDVAAVIPFFVTLGIRLSGQQQSINSNTYTGLRLLRILRIARGFKFFRVFKSVKSLRVLATTVRQSLLDFFIMIIILTLLGFLFGAAAYYAENSSNGVAFDSIPKATYWGVMTVTTVG